MKMHFYRDELYPYFGESDSPEEYTDSIEVTDEEAALIRRVDDEFMAVQHMIGDRIAKAR